MMGQTHGGQHLLLSETSASSPWGGGCRYRNKKQWQFSKKICVSKFQEKGYIERLNTPLYTQRQFSAQTQQRVLLLPSATGGASPIPRTVAWNHRNSIGYGLHSRQALCKCVSLRPLSFWNEIWTPDRGEMVNQISNPLILQYSNSNLMFLNHTARIVAHLLPLWSLCY